MIIVTVKSQLYCPGEQFVYFSQWYFKVWNVIFKALQFLLEVYQFPSLHNFIFIIPHYLPLINPGVKKHNAPGNILYRQERKRDKEKISEI